MAAPSSAYSGQKLPAHLSGVAKYDNYLAFKLGEYGGNIKGLFYLEHLLSTQNGSILGFLGAVDSAPSSISYRMRNPSRFSKLRIRNNTNNHTYIVCNDGGLNTKAYASCAYPVTRFANRFKVDFVFNSSYYDATSEYGYEVSVNNGSFFRYMLGGYIPPQSNASGRYTIYGAGQYNDLIRFRPYTINPEGTFIGDEQYFYAENLIYNIGGRQRLGSSCDYTNEQNVEVWFKGNDYANLANIQTFAQSTDIYAYTNDDMNVPIGTGYYYFDDITRVYYAPNGEFQQYISCQPPPAAKDTEIYTQMWDDTHYGVQINVNTSSNYYYSNITISGYLAMFSSNNQQQGGLDGGDGTFNIYIPAGQGYGIQNTSFYIVNGLPSGWYVKAFITSASPSNLSYNNHY